MLNRLPTILQDWRKQVSTPISDKQERMEILQLLYKRQIENPKFSELDRAIIQDALKFSKDQLESNILYLKEKNLVTFTKYADSKWIFAKITLEGINVIENKDRYVDQYTFTQASTNQTDENNTQTITHSNLNSYPEQLTMAFNQARNQIRGTRLPNSNLIKIEKQLKDLEVELQKNKIDLGKIQKICNELSKNDYSINPSISKVVLETIRTALNLS